MLNIKNQQDVVFRKMTETDLEMVMHWRMLPEITKYMNTDPKLNLQDQKEWFAIKNNNTDNYLFIIEVDKLPVGIFTILDLDRKNSRCSSGLYIAVKEKRSLELALRIECNIYDFIFDTLELNKTFAEIFSENKGVIRLKQMCGSEIEGVLKEHICKNNKFHDVTIMAICNYKWKEIKKKFNYNKISFMGY